MVNAPNIEMRIASTLILLGFVEVSVVRYWKIFVCHRQILLHVSTMFFFLYIIVVVNPVVVCSIAFIIRMVMNAHSVPDDPVPCLAPCIGK